MLSLSFTFHFDNYELDDLVRPHGPLFHRWLPDGRNDVIVVPTVDRRNRLEFWFERRGYVDHAFIRYDKTREEVDVGVMRRQGHLDGGQVWGEAQYAHATPPELAAVRDDREGSDEYVALGKRVIEFVQPPLTAFIDLLRTQYGQYWLPELRPWDSRRESLGGYCATTLWLRWRESSDQDWKKFRPTRKSVTIVAKRLPGRGCGEYLTETDWRAIQATFKCDNTQPLALRLIARAHELREAGHVSEALVQAVTGVELGIEYFLRARGNGAALSGQFFDLPLKTQLSVLATAAELVPAGTLENAVKAIDLRNEIVHHGKQPSDSDRQLLLSLVECGRALLGLKELKTPVLYAGNEQSEPA
jgi:hypothetical protein